MKNNKLKTRSLLTAALVTVSVLTFTYTNTYGNEKNAVEENEAENVETDAGWVTHNDAPLITSENAKNITEWENTPASVVTYFFASKIRNDDKWKQVMPPPEKWTKNLKRKMTNYDAWRFTKFRVIAEKEYEQGRFWVKIFMEIEYMGEKESGTDEVTLARYDGRWVIVSVPT